VGAPLGHAGHHRQHRGGPVQRLDLGLLIHTQHQRGVRRIQVEPDDVANLVDEQRVGGQFERVGAMRLGQRSLQIDPRWQEACRAS